MTWTIEYANDTGPNDESYWEFWTVTDGDRSFRCEHEDDAKWLCEVLNKLPQSCSFGSAVG